MLAVCILGERPTVKEVRIPAMLQSPAADLPEGGLTTLSCFSKKYVYKLFKTDEGISIKTSPKY